MRTILRIMKTELRILFCSPIAWLILIVFAFQAGYCLWDLMDGQLKMQLMGDRLYAVTSTILAGRYGVFTQMLKNLYLYIPLLTMGIMSRELSCGSIKLLYSSSASNFQIIMGKYLSTMVYGLAMVFILILGMLVVFSTVESPDIAAILTALLGFYLTICAYSAIGLFMSTITHYQVVAAMGTLVLLAVLNFVGEVGQSIDFIRDLTYWLSISGRSYVFMDGMICSQDILYFLLVISLFITLSIVKLKSERQTVHRIMGFMRYVSVFAIVLLLGYVSSHPLAIKYYDATQAKRNTLSTESQTILSKIEDGLTITTYVNILNPQYYIGMPENRNRDKAKFTQYFRFKPEIEMKYVYYYDKTPNAYLDGTFPELNDREKMLKLCSTNNFNPKKFISPEEIKKQIDLSGEDNCFVRVLERKNGQRAFLRIYNDNRTDPSEGEISAAFKTFLVKSPEIRFVTGHGERSISQPANAGYQTFTTERNFRYSLINQGFHVNTINLQSPIPQTVDILVISDMRNALTETEFNNYMNFVERGGNIVILGEPKRQLNMNPLLTPLGLKLTDNILVQPSKEHLDDLVMGYVTDNATRVISDFNRLTKNCITMTTTCGIEYVQNENKNKFTTTELLKTKDKGVWNELETTNFIDEKSICKQQKGEIEKSYPLMIYLSRKVQNKEQRIFVIGDADCISTTELSMKRKDVPANNFGLIPILFKHLSYGEYPIEINRKSPLDNTIYYTQKSLSIYKIIFIWMIPLIMILAYLWIWNRRRNR